MTHTEIFGGVCVLEKFCNVHPPFHGLRIPLDTHHVQMYFFHATACRSNPIPTKLFQATDHTFPQAATPISVFEALLR